MSARSIKIRVAKDLTARQREVIERLAAGLNTKEIAMALNISAKTVEYHRVQLMKRTGLLSSQELTKLAVRLGLTTIDV